jgi:translation initiation factor IF-3
VEQQPLMEGRNMHMLVAPIKGAFDKIDIPETSEE